MAKYTDKNKELMTQEEEKLIERLIYLQNQLEIVMKKLGVIRGKY
jgi:CCR4-NOT transcriptional regulation complex NOT5 subunit